MGKTLFFRLSCAVRSLSRALVLSVTVSTTAVLSACGADNNVLSPAFFENVDRQFAFWAISGTSAALPAGYQFTTESLVRPQVLGNGTINFDVAFDIDAAGKVVVLPVRLVAPLPPGRSPSVGFLRWSAAYEQLERAPDRGYVADSSVVLGVGETISVQLTNSGCNFGEPFYAKLTVDEISVPTRRMLVRLLVNRNCGYRSLTAGVPKD